MSNNNAAIKSTNATPYRNLVAEFVASAIALFETVCQRHPEANEIPGHLYAAFDGATSAVLIMVRQPDGSAVLVERINVDLKSPALFGSSEMHAEPFSGPTH